jgi:peptidoglycan/LPS O-acetylase OafA/YrhL
LRILPIYYIAIFILWFSGDSETKESFWWLATFLTNFHFTTQGWFNGATAHLWTLAVEQQFYLLWPMAILFLPRNKLISTIILMIICGPAFRLYVYSGLSDINEINGIGGNILTFANTDALGIGALLSYFENSDKEYDLTIKYLGLHLAPPFIFIGVTLKMLNINSIIYGTLSITGFCMFFLWIIYNSKIGYSGVTGDVLNNSAIRYIGKISYGLYLYHLLVLHFFRLYAPSIVLIDDFNTASIVLSKTIKFTTVASCTLAISIFSYHFIENPINRLKRFFVY